MVDSFRKRCLVNNSHRQRVDHFLHTHPKLGMTQNCVGHTAEDMRSESTHVLTRIAQYAPFDRCLLVAIHNDKTL